MENLHPVAKDYLTQTWELEILKSYEKRAEETLAWWTGQTPNDESGDLLAEILKSAGASFEHVTMGTTKVMASCGPNMEIRLYHPGEKAEVFWFDPEEMPTQRIPSMLAILFFLSPISNPGFAPYKAQAPQDGTVGELWHGRLTAPKIFSCDPVWWAQ